LCLKREVAILAASGREWSERAKRLAARVPGLEIFAQGLVERRDGGWRITDAGRSALELMERKPAASEGPPAQIAAMSVRWLCRKLRLVGEGTLGRHVSPNRGLADLDAEFEQLSQVYLSNRPWFELPSARTLHPAV
jgi:hypothetical protein